MTSYFSRADGALICFDLTNSGSFYNIKTLIERFRANNKQAPIILVGCKADLIAARDVSYEEASGLASLLGIAYIEVSALKERNVKEGFQVLAQQMYVAAQIKKIKPLLDEQYQHYCQSIKKKRSHLFLACSRLNIAKESPLKEEYYHSLQQFYQAREPEALTEICIKILDLLERAEQFYEQDHPYWSIMTHSSLAQMLRRALDVLCRMPAELVALADIRELISKDRFFCSALR